jgi:hypothetical protein
MPDCGAGMTIGSGTSRSRQKYYYYRCNARTNVGQRCKCPNIRREKLDQGVLQAVEKRILGPGRLKQLLKDVIEISDGKREKLQQELTQANAERTRRRTSIDRLLVLIEEGVMKASDPEFANRLSENRNAVATLTARIEVLESQLARGSRKITPEVLEKFSQQLREKLHDDDPTLRKAYLRMLVDRVERCPTTRFSSEGQKRFWSEVSPEELRTLRARFPSLTSGAALTGTALAI